jgi:hypothetical protein
MAKMAYSRQLLWQERQKVLTENQIQKRRKEMRQQLISSASSRVCQTASIDPAELEPKVGQDENVVPKPSAAQHLLLRNAQIGTKEKDHLGKGKRVKGLVTAAKLLPRLSVGSLERINEDDHSPPNEETKSVMQPDKIAIECR